MANEITISAELRFAKSGARDGLGFGPATFTMTGSKHIHGRQAISNSADEALTLGEVGSGGWLLVINRDATNYVVLKGAAAAVALARLGPGEPALFRLDDNAVAPVGRADTAPVEIEYLLIQK